MRSFGMIRELDPSPAQIKSLKMHVGSARFAQNWSLMHVKKCLEDKVEQSWSSFSLHTAWREHREEVAPWYTEVSKEAFQYGCERASNALKNFSKNRKHFKFPKFRKRGHNDSVCYTDASLKTPTRIKIPRIKNPLRMKEELVLPEGTRITAVFVRERAGRWFASFKIREDSWTAPIKNEITVIVGVDAGIGEHLAVFDSGEKIDNPRWLRQAESSLKYAQKALSRTQKGSNRRNKARMVLAKVHMRVANKRKDFLHKFTTDLIKNHDEIVIEDLNLAGMSKRKGFRLGKSVHDASWSEIRRQLEYKCSWYGKTLTVVDRFFPSSKKCSSCGKKNEGLALSDRIWTCSCGATHDRDVNAAKNLVTQSKAGSSLVFERGDDVRQEPALAVVSETRSSESFDFRI